MFNKIKYPALNAKMKGMYTKNLNKDELDELLRQSNLKEAISILKSKFPNLENVSENTSRMELEQELNNLFIDNIIKLSKYLNKDEKELFMLFLSKYEINIVKNVYRNVTTNRDSNRYLKNVNSWTSRLFKGIDGINNVQTEEEFLKIIKSQDYSYIFEEYKKDDKEIPLEELEVKLDKYYFKNLYEAIEQKNNELMDIIGTEIDLLNITWIYRANKYFEYSFDEIKEILIPITYKLNKNIIKELINANEFEEMKTIIQKTYYKKVFTEELYIEHDINQYLYSKYIKYFKEELFNICTIFCDINLIDIEGKNIVNIIEGIRYDLDKTEIQKRIII